jgi:hypothetical protein
MRKTLLCKKRRGRRKNSSYRIFIRGRRTKWTVSYPILRMKTNVMVWTVLQVISTARVQQEASVLLAGVQSHTLRMRQQGRRRDTKSRVLGTEWPRFSSTTFQEADLQTQKTNSVAFSPRATYTDWTTTTGRRGGTPTAVNLSVRPEPLVFLSSTIW